MKTPREGKSLPELDPELKEVYGMRDIEFKMIVRKFNEMQENTDKDMRRSMNNMKENTTKELELIKKNQTEM